MNSPNIGFNSYVEIATCMVNEDSDYRRLQQSVPHWREGDAQLESAADGAETDFEINAPDLLKLEWSKRVEEWQRLYPDGGPPVGDCTSLKDIKFGAFFLQHPIAAISLWNVMQHFYALDRFVCCTSEESREKISEWESMPPFEYLEASSVEKRWRKCLQNLSKEIKNEENRDAISSRMDGMLSSTAKLEDACRELQRSLKENLKDMRMADSMPEQINVAIGWRYSMIDTYFKIYENHNGETNSDGDVEYVRRSADSKRDRKFEKLRIPPLEEPRRFKPLSRSNSLEIVKYHCMCSFLLLLIFVTDSM